MKNNKKLAKLRGEQLKLALERYELKAVDITKNGRRSESQVSDWINGKVTISEPSLRDIIDEYLPKVRLEFLLGYDKYMTEEEKRYSIESQKWNRSEALVCIINNAFKSQGHKLKMCVVGESFNGYKPKSKDGYYILNYPENHSDETFSILSLEEFFRLKEEIETYTEYIVQKLIKEKCEKDKSPDIQKVIREYLRKWVKKEVPEEEINRRLKLIDERMTEEEVRATFEKL